MRLIGLWLVVGWCSICSFIHPRSPGRAAQFRPNLKLPNGTAASNSFHFADVGIAAVEKSLGKQASDQGTGYSNRRELIPPGPSVPGAPRIIVDLEEFDKRMADSRDVDGDAAAPRSAK